jgi:hypothetical protein
MVAETGDTGASRFTSTASPRRSDAVELHGPTHSLKVRPSGGAGFVFRISTTSPIAERVGWLGWSRRDSSFDSSFGIMHFRMMPPGTMWRPILRVAGACRRRPISWAASALYSITAGMRPSRPGRPGRPWPKADFPGFALWISDFSPGFARSRGPIAVILRVLSCPAPSGPVVASGPVMTPQRGCLSLSGQAEEKAITGTSCARNGHDSQC